MRRSGSPPLLLLLLAAAPTPAFAQAAPSTPQAAPSVAPPAPSTPQAPAAASPALDQAAALRLAGERAAANDCAGALAAVDPILSSLTGAVRVRVQKARLLCLAQRGRLDEAGKVYAELMKAAPHDAAVRQFGVAAAMDAQDPPLAAARLSAIAEDDPALLPAVNETLIRSLFAQLDDKPAARPARDRLDLALARAGWQSPDHPELAQQTVERAIRLLLARGEVDEARAMLQHVDTPEILVSMAIDRAFQPLWPDVEAAYGDHGERAIDGFAADRLDAYARTPADPRTQRDAVRAFVLLGRTQDATDLGATVPIRDGMSEEDVAAVRYQAQALAAAGNREAAIARLSGFAAIDIATAPAAVSGLVVYAEMLDEAGRSQEALAVSRKAAERGRAALSPWGLGWLRRSEACALAKLGPASEAKAAGDNLVTGAAENQAAAVEGLLCLGRTADAARVAIAALGEADGAERLADQFQPQGAYWAMPASRLRALWAGLLARPDVKAAFERAARILPRKLWPNPGPQDVPRPAEAWPASATA